MANYYWVGNSGTWDNSSTANWATVSGGAGGNGPPTSADNVFFDSLSGTGTCTTAATASASQLILNSSSLVVSLGANLTLTSAFSFTRGTLTLNNNVFSTTVVGAENTNTKVINFGTGSISVTGNNLTVWQMTSFSNFSYTGTPTVNFTYSGSVGTRTFRIAYASGATQSNVLNLNITGGADTLNFAAFCKNLNFTGFAGTLINAGASSFYGDLTISSGMTLNANATALSFVGTSGTQMITTNGRTLDCPLTFNGVGGTFAFQDALTQGLTRAFTITNGTVQLKSGATSIVGSFVTSGTNQKFLQSTLAGTQATLSQASGTVSASYLTIKDISATGGATWNAFTTNSNVDAGNNLGWDFSTQIGRYIYTRRKNKRILS